MRVSIFGPKDKGIRISGDISKEAAALLGEKQKELEALYRNVHGHAPAAVSYAAVVEYMLRGRAATRKIFESLRDE